MPALANYKDSLIVVTGGRSREKFYCEPIKSVEIYCVESDSWSIAPSLNQARERHSSCCLADYVYVAGDGMRGEEDDERKGIIYVERLKVRSIESLGAAWEVLSIQNFSFFKPRFELLMAPVSETELVFLGGV